MDGDEPWLQAAGGLGVGELARHDAASLALGAVIDESRAGSHLVGALGEDGRLRGEHRSVDQIRIVRTEGFVLDVADQPAIPRSVLGGPWIDVVPPTMALAST